MPISISMDMPADIFSALHRSPVEFAAEMRIAAAAKWYEIGEISQENAAELAGLSRGDFLLALARFKVSPFQETIESLYEGDTDAV